MLLEVLFHFLQGECRLLAMQEEKAFVPLVAIAAKQFDFQDGAKLGGNVAFFLFRVVSLLFTCSVAAVTCSSARAVAAASGAEAEIAPQTHQDKEKSADDSRATDFAEEYRSGARRPMKRA